MTNNHRPHGMHPTAWEADVLKIRAFEMVLILFYMEDLKKFLLASIEFTDKLKGMNRLDDGKPNTKQRGEGKKIKLARAVLVSEGVISQTESDELKNLLDYRNIIGHQIHHLTVDVGAYSALTRCDAKTFMLIPPYDYSAAKRARQLRQMVMNRMREKFVLSVSVASLAFEAAEKTYITEIKRLKARANKAIDQANAAIAETNRIIEAIPNSVKEPAQVDRLRNVRKNGTVSAHGASHVFRLFDAGATPLAVAYMMRISIRSANLWFKKWQAARPG